MQTTIDCPGYERDNLASLFPGKVNISVSSHLEEIDLVYESEVLKFLSDEKVVEMLTIIYNNKPLVLSDLGITRKRYYTRLRSLLDFGLIRKAGGRYRLSSLGKVIFHWHLCIKDTILNEYWKLKMIDLFDKSGVPYPERQKMISELMGNTGKLKQMLNF